MANDLRYIFNLPVEIDDVGKLYPFTISEFIEYGHLFGLLTITVNSLLQKIDINEVEKRKSIEKNIKIFDIFVSESTLLQPLGELLSRSFHTENVVWYQETEQIAIDGKIIDRNNFNHIRNQIIKINDIHLPKQAKNKELQEWYDKKNKLNNSNNNSDFEDTITSIMAFTGYTPEQLLGFTIYQANKLISRLNKISEYESNIQFLCVGAKNIKLEHWSTHIEDIENDDISFDKFKENMNGATSRK